MELKHGFIRGMNRDVSKDKFPNDMYSYLLNGRVTANEAGTISDITNILGNTNADIDDNSLSRSGYVIIGYVSMLDDIVLFYTEDSATGADSATTYAIIDRLVYNGDDSYTRNEVWNAQGLNLRIDKPVRAVSRFESEGTQKIYWVDDNNSIRFSNIGEDISAYTVDRFDRLGDLKLEMPVFKRYTPGQLKVGSIAYAQRYVKQGGQATLFSTATPTIPVGRGIGKFSYRNYKGDPIYDASTSYDSGSGVAMEAYANADQVERYDYIEVVSLWYSDEDAVPDINIVARLSMDADKAANFYYYYEFTDTGANSFGTLTLAEFVEQSIAFKAKDIITKDNRLFVGNITETYFDIDEDATWTGKSPGDKYDARAFRFDSTGRCELMDIEDVDTWVGGGSQNTEYVLTGASPAFSSVEETADAINPFNRITRVEGNQQNTQGRDQKYQSNSGAIGGSGINIDFTFGATDNYMISNSAYIGTGHQGMSLTGNLTNNEQLGLYRGFQRDDVYRFGIVFFDEKGRQSFVKWIADIRMSDANDTVSSGTGIAYNSAGDDYNSRLVYPFFYINNNPQIDGVNLDYQIVYVKRTKSDRGVIMAGMLQPTRIHTGSVRRCEARPINIGEYTANYGVAETEYDEHLFNFATPELAYALDDEYFDLEFIQIAGEYVTAPYHSGSNAFLLASENFGTAISPTTDPSVAESQLISRKYLGIVETSLGSRASIEDYIKSIPVTTDTVEFNIEGKVYKHSSRISSGDSTMGRFGTAFTINVGAGITKEGSNANYYYAYARKNVFESQYGGLSYSSRQQNTYIEAGDLLTPATPKGDVYIQVFEHGRSFGDIDGDGIWAAPDSTHMFTEFTGMTVETTMNLNTKLDVSFFREIYSSNIDATKYIREEPVIATDPPVTWGSMYNYNDAYNKIQDSRSYFPKPEFFNDIDIYSTRIRYSDVGYDNTDIDSLLKFDVNNYNDANKAYGELNRLVEFQDKIFAFQDNAVSIVSINPRVTQQSSDGVEIILGSGEVIDDFRYLSTDIGCQDNSDVIRSFSSLYWLDNNRKKIYALGSNLESISDLRGLHAYFKNNITEDSRFVGVYDVKNSEVLMTVVDDNPNTIFQAGDLGGGSWNLTGVISAIETPFAVDHTYAIESGFFTYVSRTETAFRFTYAYGTDFTDTQDVDLSAYIIEKDNFTLCYNEKLPAFTSFYSFLPSLYVYHSKGYFSSNNSNALYQHDISDEYNTFYGTAYPMTLKLISSFGAQKQGEFNNIKFFAEITEVDGDYIRNETLTNISAKNNYQFSDDIILYPMHLPEDIDRTKYILDTSAKRIGEDWYVGLNTSDEGLVVYLNQLYRNTSGGDLATTPGGVGWSIAELCNIRKTEERWMAAIPRIDSVENSVDVPMSDRLRSDWLELTLEFKDTVPYDNSQNRRVRLSDVILETYIRPF